MKIIFLFLFFLGVTLGASAEELPSESGLCREERKAYNDLRQELSSFRKRTSQIDDLLEGKAPADVTTEDLKSLLRGDDGETLPTEWPKGVRCDALQEDYRKAREALVWQKAQLARLRTTYWSGLPSPIHEAMVNIWQSRAQVTRSAQAIIEAGASSELDTLSTPVAALDTRLQSVRLSFLQLLPGLKPEMSSREVSKWLQQWRISLDLAGSNFSPPPTLLESLDANQAEALHHHYRVALSDALVITNAYNTVRGWLWKEQRKAFHRAEMGLAGDSQLLVDESRAMGAVLHWLVTGSIDGVAASSSRGMLWRVFIGIEYLLGLLGFVVLALLARSTRKPAAAAQANFARRYRGSHTLAQVVRLTSGISVILPWAIGWLGLEILEQVFRKNHLSLLLPLLPFARLYIVYGLLCLAGEWFLHRISNLAGVYLSAQQNEEIAERARRFARIVILPWLMMDLVALTLGPSLSLQILDWLTLLAVLVAFGLLLKPWRSEFIKALQSFLPESWDTWVERIFSSWRFVLLAPLAAPFMVVALTLYFLHKGLVDFDWYRKLMARSFKLRSGQGDEDEVEQSDERALADYQQWFEASSGDEAFPFITIDVSQRLQDYLSAWLQEKSEENSLLFSGERGSGKTTVLKKAREWLVQQDQGLDIQYLEVPAKRITPSEVATLLEPALGVSLSDGPAELVKSDEARKPTILVLDNAQNLFLRKVGGLEGWEFLLSLTRARLSNLYWIVVINNQSWAYLGNVFGHDYQFNRLLYTRRWSQSEIRSLILSRNNLSGYRIHYDSILLSSRGPEAGNIRNAEQLYFSLLWDACRGNPLLALRLWLTSVTVNNQRVTVGLPAEVSGAALERLSKEMHFVYAALVLHENMTSEELVAATALPESRVRAALKTAFDIGFVQRSENRRYRIVPLWYPVVTRLLARKNLLHE